MTTAKYWQQSYSGKVVTPRELKPEQVTLEDIPHSLAQKVRFNGQLSVPGYTVAQHTILGAQEFLERGEPRLALAFLLHEVDEVYLPDVPSPIKPFLKVEVPKETLDLFGPTPTPKTITTQVTWSELCQQHAHAIFEKLGLLELLPLLDDPLIHDMDLRMLMTEKRDLMGPEPQPWGFTHAPLDFHIGVWGYATNKSFWLTLYKHLRETLGL